MFNVMFVVFLFAVTIELMNINFWVYTFQPSSYETSTIELLKCCSQSKLNLQINNSLNSIIVGMYGN